MKKLLMVLLSSFCILTCAGCTHDNEDKTTADTTHDEIQNEITGVIAGHTLECDDGSSLQLKGDGSYVWYKDPSNTKDNYYEGTYSMYNGNEAVKAVADIEALGLSEEEQYKLIEEHKKDGVTVDDWFLMIQHRSKKVVNNVPSENSDDIVYVGFYYDDLKVYDALNCNTGNYTIFNVK